MADPLSIVAGVVQLLQTTWTVGYELKRFHDDATVIGKTISDLQQDVESLVRVLESMRDTFASITAEHGSGHIGTLWTNVARSIEDAKGVLNEIQSQIQEINKETSFLDDYRKQLRLNRAEPKLARFRGQIQSYKDSLQLSLQAIILGNQTSYQATANQVLPNLNDLHNDVRRIALDLTQRIEALQFTKSSAQDETQVVAMQNLHDCVRSAAGTISSASTIMASRQGTDQKILASSSDFGDVFPVQYSVAMRRWVDSNTIYEYDEAASRDAPHSVADVPILGESDNGSDSDVDLEAEMTQLLLETGKQKLAAGDPKGGERMLRNCLKRVESPNVVKSPRETAVRLDVIVILHDLYLSQRKLPEAQRMLLQKMAIHERILDKKDPKLLQDVVNLAKLHMQKGDFVEAQLHARRALKGYRKLQNPDDTKACLSLLIEICNADGNESDKDAYNVLLTQMNGGNDDATTVSLSKRIQYEDGAETPRSQPSPGDVPSDQYTQAHGEITKVPHSDAKSNSAGDLVLSPELAGVDLETPSASKVEEVKPLERFQQGHDNDILDKSLNDGPPYPPSPPDHSETDVHELQSSHEAAVSGEAPSVKETAEKVEVRTPTPPRIVEPVPGRQFSFSRSEKPEEEQFSYYSAGRSELSKLTDFESIATGSSYDGPTPLRILNKTVSAPDMREASLASSPPTSISGDPSQHGTSLTVPSWTLPDLIEQAALGKSIPREQLKHSRNVSAPLLQPSTSEQKAPTTFDQMRLHGTEPRIGRRFSFESSVESVAGSEALRPARSISVSKPKPGPLSPPRIKVVVVGDTCVGKTPLLNVLSTGKFLGGLTLPTTIATDVTWVNVDGRTIELALWDNSGLDGYSRLRIQSYTGAHVVLICFAIDSPDSLDNVSEVWRREVIVHCDGVPILLVGTKMDLRGNDSTIEQLCRTSQHPVTRLEGEKCRSKIGAQGYFECSARNNQGVAELFEAATRVALRTKITKTQDKKKGILAGLSFKRHRSRS